MKQYEKGTLVKVLEKSDPFPNGGSHVRTGLDVEDEREFPIHADIRGFEGSILQDWGHARGGVIFQTKIEGRTANFIVPGKILAPL